MCFFNMLYTCSCNLSVQIIFLYYSFSPHHIRQAGRSPCSNKTQIFPSNTPSSHRLALTMKQLLSFHIAEIITHIIEHIAIEIYPKFHRNNTQNIITRSTSLFVHYYDYLFVHSHSHAATLFSKAFAGFWQTTTVEESIFRAYQKIKRLVLLQVKLLHSNSSTEVKKNVLEGSNVKELFQQNGPSIVYYYYYHYS